MRHPGADHVTFSDMHLVSLGVAGPYPKIVEPLRAGRDPFSTSQGSLDYEHLNIQSVMKRPPLFFKLWMTI